MDKILSIILISVIAFFSGIYSSGKIKIENLIQPSPTMVLLPTRPPTPTPTLVKKVVNTNSNNNQNIGKITCTGPDGKSFQTTEAECIKFNQAWGSNGTANNNSNNNQTLNGKVNCWEKRSDGTYVYNFGTISKADCDAQYKALSDSLSHFRDPVTGNTMVDCKFTSSDFNFDFGRITSDQCKAKSDAFWKEKNEAIKNRPTIGSQNPNPTSVPAQKTKSQCQEEVRVKYERYQLQYGGSSLEAVNQNYSAEMNACNQYQ